jgi:hypothetical protein
MDPGFSFGGAMTNEELAELAYEEWDLYGGKALGHWGAPYTKEAWVKVVELIRAEVLKERANVTT